MFFLMGDVVVELKGNSVKVDIFVIKLVVV